MAGQKILLGVAGGIAAYKTPELVRRLKDRGADVQVVMTRSANEFVTATTLQAVSGRPVRDNLWDPEAEAAMGHIELARWADVVLIAPATAEIMSRLASGSAPDLLTTLCLATEAPLVLAPAMNRIMWANPAVQENRQKLEARGVRMLGPGIGDQACGETGEGRMLEPDEIVAAISGPAAVPHTPLAGLTVLVTAGPTREAIDQVRYLSNRSSGKMGFAVAAAARDAGAKVILVSGPVQLDTPAGVERIDVESARDMFQATHANIDDVDIFIAAAAVGDYHVAEVAPGKLKKTADKLELKLAKTPDILASVARLENGPFTVGFAAETEHLEAYARGKLRDKHLDMIVANLVGPNRGFDQDDNAVDVFWADGHHSIKMAPKAKVASELVPLIAKRYAARNDQTRPELPAIAIRE